ncbi:prepilin-type N-terminal cleavage/methylation domain-containing protein [Vibrio sp. NFV-1]|uniref:Prepilin-type N-terminal cleavage/methylation domain-containing protein n=2 Tax=Vibrio nitrifigilis TaxID=2789781 RepID=A0ABS0G9E5_9VIBR|nr:prepilin-type N-terminal cleavage/methylation domain-containing protein [Vibrio nitrifigilis]
MEMIRKNGCNDVSNQSQGMTLIELLIVVIIIGVLTSVAYPSYSQYVKKSYRQQVINDMARIQLYIEQNRENPDAIMDSGICNQFCRTSPERYRIEITISPDDYLISAIPQESSGQRTDRCNGDTYTRLSLAESGEIHPEKCWQ